MLHRVQLPKHYVANVNHRTARPECFTVSIVLSHALTYSTRYGQPVDTGEPPRPPHQQSAAGTLHVSYIMKTTLIPRRTHRQPPAKLAASTVRIRPTALYHVRTHDQLPYTRVATSGLLVTVCLHRSYDPTVSHNAVLETALCTLTMTHFLLELVTSTVSYFGKAPSLFKLLILHCYCSLLFSFSSYSCAQHRNILEYCILTDQIHNHRYLRILKLPTNIDFDIRWHFLRTFNEGNNCTQVSSNI